MRGWVLWQNNMARIILVDENDQPIGFRERAERRDDDIIRVTGLCVYNSKNEFLIAKRVHTKKYDPGLWGPATAGTVDEGETYLSNIIKEAKEEIGLEMDARAIIQGPCRRTQAETRYFVQRFFYKSDLPIEKFAIQKNEVAEIRWIHISELVEWIARKPDDFIEAFKGPESIVNDFITFSKNLDICRVLV